MYTQRHVVYTVTAAASNFYLKAFNKEHERVQEGLPYHKCKTVHDWSAGLSTAHQSIKIFPYLLKLGKTGYVGRSKEWDTSENGVLCRSKE